ncbi:unnamed protein product [Sphagnum troendelagicum]|uniref:B box-type domain-containing protein n=1 Tax=Sphagnum troendelagicum TaxID=128251 RepID=A0ABP0TFN1_9BRYO
MVGYDLSLPLQKPAWLEALLSEKFFVACTKHAALKKNERNVFCVDCNGGVCQHCVGSHRTSHCVLLQIRRYVYHDVIRLQDIQRLLDCSQVQTYIINSARVVFLNQRPQPRPSKGLGNSCGTCERSLQDSYSYCSVACKVDDVFRQGTSLEKSSSLLLATTKHLPSYSSAAFKTSFPAAQATAAGGNDSERLGYGTTTMISTASTLLMPKKLRSGRLSTLTTSSSSPKYVLLPVSVKRRKGIPHRSPCC